jgi:hypothetical protein
MLGRLEAYLSEKHRPLTLRAVANRCTNALAQVIRIQATLTCVNVFGVRSDSGSNESELR